MLPYLQDRPLVLTRFPDGIHGKSFYQRDAPEFVPEWIRREVLWSEGAEREVHYFIVDDAASLRYLINLGTIPIHTWHSRVADLAHPDWCVLDLDPKDAPFASVIARGARHPRSRARTGTAGVPQDQRCIRAARADSDGGSTDARSVAHLRAPAGAHHRRPTARTSRRSFASCGAANRRCTSTTCRTATVACWSRRSARAPNRAPAFRCRCAGKN